MKFWSFIIPITTLTHLKLSAQIQQLVVGLNSGLPLEKEHIITWDLDNCTLKRACGSLQKQQKRHKLGDIFITSDREGSYRAICYTKVKFLKMIEIIAGTEEIDLDFVRIACRRKYATVRISPKLGRNPPKLLYTLKSKYPSVTPPECVIEQYWTRSD